MSNIARNTQRLTVLAQDPSVRIRGHLLFARVEIPHEMIEDGPTGYRVKVVDFDVTSNKYYKPHRYVYDAEGLIVDPFAPPTKKMTARQRRSWEQKLLDNPNFHAQHVYAVTMRILARFEFALGRRLSWSFDGHQLHIAPHAFCEANAYYSKPDRALLFGYFEGRSRKVVFTCLSHDIVAHEVTHALLDGLRERYTDPSGPDQAAFHEGFSDVVALLSMFALKPIITLALTGEGLPKRTRDGIELIQAKSITVDALRNSILFGLGEQFGRELVGARANALRRSIKLKPNARQRSTIEAHDRGEIFAAAVLNSFLKLWVIRIKQLGTFGNTQYNLNEVISEGAKIADHLLSIVIRALDYCPSVDMEFGDYLAALLTVDREVAPDDNRFNYREVIQTAFAEYFLQVPSLATDGQGCWKTFDQHDKITYSKTNFESMLRDREEVFRFIWENRKPLGIDPRGYTEVISVRTSVRQGPDGFFLKETICEYVQILEIFGSEVESALGIARPEGMLSTQFLEVYGGGVLVFDQYGRIKYHIERRVDDKVRQAARLDHLWLSGALEQRPNARERFAVAHQLRASRE